MAELLYIYPVFAPKDIPSMSARSMWRMSHQQRVVSAADLSSR